MANNAYVNKVQLANGTVLIDISDTTAAASDVAAGKVFYTAAGVPTTGTASGSGGIIIEDTLDAAGGTIRQITAEAFSKATLLASENTTYTAPSGTLWNEVNVSVAGGGSDCRDTDIIMRTISGVYENSEITNIGSYAFAYCSALNNVSFPNATSLGNSAFYYCSALSSVSFPMVSSIGSQAFRSCLALNSASFPNATSIGSYAFYSCFALSSISFPSATSIGVYAFAYCSALTVVNFSMVTSIGSNAFYSCSALSAVSFPSATSIDVSTFYNCYALNSVSFPSATSIGNYAFYNCSALNSASFPNVTFIGSNAFAFCSALTVVNFSMIASISSYAFQYCKSLNTVILNNSSAGAKSIYGSAFMYCYNLLSLYILASRNIYTLGTITTFHSTPISNYTTSTGGVYGSIFVPEAIYSSYISATNWATFSNRFVSLTDAQVQHVIDYGTHVM